MRKLFAILSALLISLISATVFAAENPTCIMMKFANDTRYKNIDSASVLSDLVMEKLLAKDRGRINLQETKPIDEDIEIMLYNEKQRDILNAEASIKQGNFNILFENGTFDADHDQSITNARVGQIISPEITSKIGREYGAQYLIQGTIVNMGNALIDDDINTQMLYVRQRKSAIAIVAEVRVIEAATGKVVWLKQSTGSKGNALTQIGSFKLGSAKLNSEMYTTAMDECAQKIVESLLADYDAGKLFVS